MKPPNRLHEHLVHHQDIRRPLGVAAWTSPEARLRDRARGRPRPRPAAGKRPQKLARGLTFRATDLDWTTGSGPAVEGPAEALIIALAGRPVALAELGGAGIGTWGSGSLRATACRRRSRRQRSSIMSRTRRQARPSWKDGLSGSPASTAAATTAAQRSMGRVWRSAWSFSAPATSTRSGAAPGPVQRQPLVAHVLERALGSGDHHATREVDRGREARVDAHGDPAVEHEGGGHGVLGRAPLQHPSASGRSATVISALAPHHLGHLAEQPPERVDGVGAPGADPPAAPLRSNNQP